MRLHAVNGYPREDAPWRGGLVVRGRGRSGGALVDPTGTLSSRLLQDADLRRACGLDRPTLPVLLTRANLDQIAALIELRHGNPIDLYTTPDLFESLSSTPTIWPALQADCSMHWRMVPLGGDQLKAQFQVEGQVGIGYTVLSCGRDDAQGSQPLLLVRDQTSGATVAWVRGSSTSLEQASEHLAEHWTDIRWLVLEGDAQADETLLDWLHHAPTPHKLLMAGDADLRRRAQADGVLVARDGLEIVLE